MQQSRGSRYLIRLHAQVEIREGWPRDRTRTDRLPFDEDEWRHPNLLRHLIGRFGKAQHAKRVLRLTEHAMDGVRPPCLGSKAYIANPPEFISEAGEATCAYMASMTACCSESHLQGEVFASLTTDGCITHSSDVLSP